MKPPPHKPNLDTILLLFSEISMYRLCVLGYILCTALTKRLTEYIMSSYSPFTIYVCDNHSEHYSIVLVQLYCPMISDVKLTCIIHDSRK